MSFCYSDVDGAVALKASGGMIVSATRQTNLALLTNNARLVGELAVALAPG